MYFHLWRHPTCKHTYLPYDRSMFYEAKYILLKLKPLILISILKKYATNSISMLIRNLCRKFPSILDGNSLNCVFNLSQSSVKAH